MERQPKIIELAGRRLDENGDTTNLNFLCNPGIPIPKKNVEITGITDEMVKTAKRFPAHYSDVVELFLGCRTFIAHNLAYDKQVMVWELTRIGKEFQFPWPPNNICTVEHTQDMQGKYKSLSDLYLLYYGEAPNFTTHRAMNDVEILHAVVNAMLKEGRI